MSNIDERLQKEQDKLAKLEKQMEQLKNQKKQILNRRKQAERKERTHRLVQNGALAEKYLHAEEMKPELFQELLEKIVRIEAVKSLLNVPSAGAENGADNE